MMSERLKTIHRVQNVTTVRLFCGLIGLFCAFEPARAQMGGFTLQPVTYQSFVPQSFAPQTLAKPLSAKAGIESASESGSQAAQSVALDMMENLLNTAPAIVR